MLLRGIHKSLANPSLGCVGEGATGIITLRFVPLSVVSNATYVETPYNSSPLYSRSFLKMEGDLQ